MCSGVWGGLRLGALGMHELSGPDRAAERVCAAGQQVWVLRGQLRSVTLGCECESVWVVWLGFRVGV